MRQVRGNCDTTRTGSLEYDLTAKGALLVLGIGVLGGRLPNRDQQPGKLDLRLLRLSFDELDADFMIRRLPGIFAAGEMLDWEAPTGGYLLQASFATGAAAGRGALKWLNPHDEARR